MRHSEEVVYHPIHNICQLAFITYKNFSKIYPRSGVLSFLVIYICNLVKICQIVLQNNFTYLPNSCLPELSPVLYTGIIFHFY